MSSFQQMIPGFTVFAVIFICLCFTTNVDATKGSLDGYRSAFLQNLQTSNPKFFENNLAPDEKLYIVGEAGGIMPWLYDTQYAAIEARKPWLSLENPNHMFKTSDIYRWLFTESNPSLSQQTDCLLSGFSTWDKFKNNSEYYPMWYLDSDLNTWLANYDNGMYRDNVSFKFAVPADKSSFEISYNSITRVNIQPREWFIPALPYLLKDSRLNPSGVCSKFSRVYDCFFDINNGYMNSITTGMIISSNIVIKSKYPGTNATIRSKLDYPNIIAWVIKRMPLHEPFCPCYNKDRSRRAYRFCTEPGLV